MRDLSIYIVSFIVIIVIGVMHKLYRIGDKTERSVIRAVLFPVWALHLPVVIVEIIYDSWRFSIYTTIVSCVVMISIYRFGIEKSAIILRSQSPVPWSFLLAIQLSVLLAALSYEWCG